MRKGKDIELSINHKDVNESLRVPYFGGAFQREPLTRRDSADKHVSNTTENQEKILGQCLLSFLLTRICCYPLSS